MPLKIQWNGPFAAPTVFCDQCATEITEAGSGQYAWLHTLIKDGTSTPIVFVHNTCFGAFEAVHGERYSSIPLVALPYYLTHNLHTTWAASKTWAERWSQ
jgi:hypothetical protein